MRVSGWLSVAIVLAGCGDDSTPPAAPVGGSNSSVGYTGALYTSGAATGTSGDSTGSDGTAGSGTTAGDSGTTAGSGGSTTATGGATTTGGTSVDTCMTWADKYIECVDPMADQAALISTCEDVATQALNDFGFDCLNATVDTIACVAMLDCPEFIAYDDGNGTIPAQCQAEVDAETAACT